jgi:uroporphyrinogen-III decarboxylase
MDTMTSRERWLAAVKLQPVDRLPFWPKLDKAYSRAQGEPFSTMTEREISGWIGSDRHVGMPFSIREVRKKTSIQVFEADESKKHIYKAPLGSMEMISRFDIQSQAYHPVVFPIKTLEDIKLMTEWYADCHVELDEESIEKARSVKHRLGSGGVTHRGIGESPLMLFVQRLAGVENAHYFLADHRDEVQALFDAIQRVLVDKVKLYAEHCPADFLYFIENTSTTLISPDQYKRYCFEHIQEYGEIMDSFDRIFVLHMCGHLKALLHDLAEIKATAFEAFTSPPVGNTTFLDGRLICRDKCLIGGTNAALWIRSADEIISELEGDLDSLPHYRGIVVSSAGIMPPLCKPATIKKVCDWVKSYHVN